MIDRRTLVAVLAGAVLTACSPPAPAPSTVGGPFRLTNQDGQAVDESLLQGRWTALFFGYTYCPDFCPMTLQALRAAEAELAPRQAKALQVVFISVDPERDTIPALKAYVADDGFPEGTIGLTGTAEQVAAAVKAYRGYAKKAREGDDYLVDHTSAVYLMDPKGRFVRVLAFGQTPTQMAEQIRDAMRTGA